ncbi:copper transporter 5.1 [Cornus florida]|uniref:copper transporter 5.1 n=1 Tax=Cornus florida TaxID=4283 RepID=UPI002899FDBE|nr:copper transporter 5.1 [Cornus florida]
MMHMTFYWSREVTLLFDSWKTDSWTSYGLTLLACLLFSIFYQYMEARRQQFQLLSVNNKPSSAAAATQTTIDTPLLYPKLAAASRIWSAARFAGAVLFGVNSAIGYLLMLAIMSFNGGVFVAVVVGLSIGYLVFRSSSADVVVVDNPCACA